MSHEEDKASAGTEVARGIGLVGLVQLGEEEEAWT